MSETSFINENEKEYLNIIESILFAVGDRVEISAIAQALDVTDAYAASLVDKLKSQYDFDMRGIRIVRTDNLCQMVTRSEYFDYVKKVIVKQNTTTLSQAALETLAIIAYRQPVTRLEIDNIRGVNSSSSLSLLIDRGLARKAGKKEDVLGKPMTYATTAEFLRLAGIENLSDLPDFEDFVEGLDSQEQEEPQAEQLKFDVSEEE